MQEYDEKRREKVKIGLVSTGVEGEEEGEREGREREQGYMARGRRGE